MRNLGTTLVALLALLILSAGLHAATVSQPARAFSGRPSTSAQNSKDHPPLRTFRGTIAKNGDQFVLNEAKTHKLYELDDQATAGRFVTKTVTITGTLDVVKNIIRIQSIAEAAA